MPDLSDVRATLAFTCAHEKDHIPPRHPDADQLYQHARWLKKNNLLKRDPAAYPRIERLVRIATAYGHDKANLELRDMIAKGQANSDHPVTETLDLTEALIRRGIPGGYYDMGRYLEEGYGVKTDKNLALKYYRKAADLGSPDGQYVVGDMLTDVRGDPSVQKIGETMWKCSAEQGHPKASLELGNWLKQEGRYDEAIQAFQLGVKAGNDLSALSLEKGFSSQARSDDRLNYLGQHRDEERAHRYKAIGDILSDYSYLNPKVPEIDKIVPLPPARLPPWDGKLQWLKEHEANVPPPLPPEERIVEMARAKGLDPETGRPLKKVSETAPVEPKPHSVAAPTPNVPLGTQLASGTLCPQTGTWECDTAHGGVRRVFVAGEVLAGVRVATKPSLLQKLKGKQGSEAVDAIWTLVELPKDGQA